MLNRVASSAKHISPSRCSTNKANRIEKQFNTDLIKLAKPNKHKVTIIKITLLNVVSY